MKSKYEVLNKDKKKEIKKGFYATDTGKYFKKHYLVSLISSIICYFYGIYMIIDNYLGDKKILLYIYGAAISITGIILTLYARKIFLRKINLYMIKDNKKR